MDYNIVEELLEKIKKSKPKILVLGDVMLDCYISGNVNRVSPEAPVPILEFKEEKYILGGAGNVVHNLTNLGADVTLSTILSDDNESEVLTGLMNELKIELNSIHYSSNISTTKKTRFISNSTQLLRLDTDSSGFKAVDYELLKKKVKSVIGKLDCIIISDYDKGVCSTDLIQYIISIADHEKIPIFIDPKGDSWSKYSNATCITPNKKEAEKELGVTLRDDTDFEKAAQSISDKYNLKSCLITRGSQGLTYSIGSKIIHQGVGKKEVFDVSGAGDTVISCMAVSYISGLKINDCLELSTILASKVVAYSGTVPFSIEMIKSKHV